MSLGGRGKMGGAEGGGGTASGTNHQKSGIKKTHRHVFVALPIGGDDVVAFTLEALGEMAVEMGGK